MTIKKILVPVDFSPPSANALRNAALFAQKTNAELEIMHCFHLLASGGDTALFVNDAMVENKRELVADQLKAQAEQIPELEPVNFSFNIAYGPTTRQLEKRLEQADVDLVIMGAKGEGGLMEKILGSTTYDLLSSANVPVLAVPENIKQLRWQKIVLALDQQFNQLENFRHWVAYLHENFSSQYSIVHVTPPNQPEKGHPPVSFDAYFGDNPYQVNEVLGADTEKRIVRFIEDDQAHLLIVFPREDNLFTHLFSKSITKSLMQKLHIPLLAFHESDKSF